MLMFDEEHETMTLCCCHWWVLGLLFFSRWLDTRATFHDAPHTHSRDARAETMYENIFSW